jgi:uncharacterized protein (DUF2235 family)
MYIDHEDPSESEIAQIHLSKPTKHFSVLHYRSLEQFLPTISMESPTSTTDYKGVPKRIIVCCDGTWYASDKGGNNLPSNVARMSRALKKVGLVEYGPDKGQNRSQVVYYQSGVGTGNLGVVDKMWQGAVYFTDNSQAWNSNI